MVKLPVREKILKKREPYERSTVVSLREILESGSRFEASAYDAEARSIIQKIRNFPNGATPIFGSIDSLFTDATNGFRFKRNFVSKANGVKFYSSSDIINLDFNSEKFLSSKITKKLSELLIEDCQILISCSGTIGNVAFAGKHLVGAACSQHVIRAKCKSRADAGFAAAFLRSKYGRKQLTRSQYGSVIQHIEPHHLSSVFIPAFNTAHRNTIGQMMVDASDKRDEAFESLSKAREILLSEVGLESFTFIEKRPSCSIVLRSDLRGRFDADFHSSDALSLEENIRRQQSKFRRLDHEIHGLNVNGVTKFRKRVFVRNTGIPMLSSKQLFQIDPVNVKQLGRGIHSKDMGEIGLSHREVCVTRSGTIGNTFIVPKYMAGWAASEHILKIVGEKAEYQALIYAWLSSTVGNLLVQRLAFGSVIKEIDRWQLEALPIPIVNLATLTQISDLVERSDTLRTEAWALETQSISEIEHRIDYPN